MSIDATDPDDRVEQLIRLTNRLNRLVLEEREALSIGKLDANAESWEEKEHLARAYRLEVKAIGDDPARLAGADTALSRRLSGAQRMLQESLEEHAAALEAVKRVAEGLVRSVSTDIASERAAPSGYGSGGKATTPTSEGGIAVNASA